MFDGFPSYEHDARYRSGLTQPFNAGTGDGGKSYIIIRAGTDDGGNLFALLILLQERKLAVERSEVFVTSHPVEHIVIMSVITTNRSVPPGATTRDEHPELAAGLEAEGLAPLCYFQAVRMQCARIIDRGRPTLASISHIANSRDSSTLDPISLRSVGPCMRLAAFLKQCLGTLHFFWGAYLFLGTREVAMIHRGDRLERSTPPPSTEKLYVYFKTVAVRQRTLPSKGKGMVPSGSVERYYFLDGLTWMDWGVTVSGLFASLRRVLDNEDK
ncbi:hypothetical protein DEU56DRAFT_754186 [Suillus clintonianus]|uniref:uncharacterized protein n=1 Tax=Suillus clintonianus TaxID=1904413 RepID=UPI001B85E7D3|nr:uncharacterized protein DEU56DRAFT_754186 [Suillus clintonianus]KAG2144519.1 hypothetical protein DEU56DRAFT_754186 [Suillus clintonianus]